jgi:hypothetical protein
MPSRAGGARFTGASASLKVVSGESTRGTTDTQTAAPNRKRTDTQRSRFTLHPKWLQNYSREYRLSMMLSCWVRQEFPPQMEDHSPYPWRMSIPHEVSSFARNGQPRACPELVEGAAVPTRASRSLQVYRLRMGRTIERHASLFSGKNSLPNWDFGSLQGKPLRHQGLGLWHRIG